MSSMSYEPTHANNHIQMVQRTIKCNTLLNKLANHAKTHEDVYIVERILCFFSFPVSSL